MNSSKYKAELELEALELGRQRRMGSASDQQSAIARRDQPAFVTITKKITDSEKKLISFITKSLAVDALLDGGVIDAFIL
ncbi:MAG: hypothetical protein ABIS36_17045 [Chryseolinea sp.]